MFQADTNDAIPLRREWSRGSFVVYDREEFERLYGTGGSDSEVYSEYLSDLERVYINAYTGTIIGK